MPPKKPLATKKKEANVEGPVVVRLPQQVAPAQNVVKETSKEKLGKETKIVDVKPSNDRDKRVEVVEVEEKEEPKEEEEEDDTKKKSKCKRFLKVLLRTFLIFVGVVLIIIGGIGYAQTFLGANFEVMKQNPNRLISRILTNLWYV